MTFSNTFIYTQKQEWSLFNQANVLFGQTDTILQEGRHKERILDVVDCVLPYF